MLTFKYPPCRRIFQDSNGVSLIKSTHIVISNNARKHIIIALAIGMLLLLIILVSVIIIAPIKNIILGKIIKDIARDAKPNGTNKPIKLVTYPIKDGDGELLGILKRIPKHK